MSEGEISRGWFSNEEHESIRHNAAKAVNKMNKTSAVIADSDNCFRGLEQFETQEAAERKVRRSSSIEAVLDEQDFQFDSKTSDDELIAELYAERTEMSALLARAMAARDEAYVRHHVKGIPKRTKSYPRGSCRSRIESAKKRSRSCDVPLLEFH
ncbi:MAG: hypothetical protein SGILL_008047 [Bacillariaceae sp.]